MGGEWYFFGTSANNHKIMSTYISKINTIYQYISHFKTEAKTLLEQNLDYRIDLNQLKKETFNSYKTKLNLEPLAIIAEEILSLRGIHISVRERDCLIYLLGGKTIKETAKLLQLSPRTVEEYLKRLKQKAGCKYKRELLALLAKNPIH
jgi:DNA-binding CsgD family transcriptional regulator